MSTQRLFITGDVNLMGVKDWTEPFQVIRDEMAQADLVFSNLECSLYAPEAPVSLEHEGFNADPEVAKNALASAGIAAVGIANNVNYGDKAICSSISQLASAGIAVTGAGRNLTEARRPAIIERNGVRYGFVQRTSVYWGNNHEATAHSPGVAVICGHTAYQPPMYRVKKALPPFNRPGLPPVIVTWADPASLANFREDVSALRKEVDVLIASCHWGYRGEVYEYMTEIARAAIDEGADAVIGHGPHEALPIGSYKGRPIFYGLGSFSFHTGHDGVKHGDWVGLMPQFVIDQKRLHQVSFRFVRHTAANATVFRTPAQEAAEVEKLTVSSAAHGAQLVPFDREMGVVLQ